MKKHCHMYTVTFVSNIPRRHLQYIYIVIWGLCSGSTECNSVLACNNNVQNIGVQLNNEMKPHLLCQDFLETGLIKDWKETSICFNLTHQTKYFC